MNDESDAHGVANEGKGQRDAAKDPVIRGGLLALGSCIDHPVAKKKPQPPIPIIGPGNGKAYYFLWSLERVAMAFGLKTIGDKDWYAWGSEILVANQRPDGSWQGDYAACGADTCFALLFLRRANLARDLTATLKGKVEDPGESVLRPGGIGGASLQAGERLQPALQANRKAVNDDPQSSKAVLKAKPKV